MIARDNHLPCDRPLMRIRSRIRRPIFGSLLALLALPLAAAPQEPDTGAVPAQVQGALRKQGMTQAEALQRLRASGMSRDELRAQLQQLGYDPSLADRYYDVIEGNGQAPRGYASNQFVQALEDMGLAPRRRTRAAAFDDSTQLRLRERYFPALDTLRLPRGLTLGDSLALADSLMLADSLRTDSLAADSVKADSFPVFGRALFRRATTQFDPPVLGPVDAGYRLGPGDEVYVIVTGAVEVAHVLKVGRDGTLVVPDVGAFVVNGLTLGDLENQLYARASQVYAGLGRGRGSPSHLQVSLGRLRTIQVYVIGDVERPGGYQVSSLATVFHALYKAGGPSRVGSFRDIQVRRGGTSQHVDLYDYLLRGDAANDLRLEQGDMVFVPPVGSQVKVTGAVKRPATYEVKPTETVRDAILLAGGPLATAALSQVHVDRILPLAQRKPGLERVALDVSLDEALQPSAVPIPLNDGDRIRVGAVGTEQKNRIVLTGDLRHPGTFEWTPGTTLWGVLGRADGLRDAAYLARAHIFRLDERNATRRLISASLAMDSLGRPEADVPLMDRDSVVVYSRERLRTREYVQIGGYVKKPGTYPLSEGMTVKDLILVAGGFAEGAYGLEAYVGRFQDGAGAEDSTARAVRVRLEGDKGSPPRPGAGDVPEWTPGADDFVLQNRDNVQVRRAPWFEPPTKVAVTGEVRFPGIYVLETRKERLADVVTKAGGLTPEGYAPGAQLFRHGDPVGVDLPGALRSGGSRADVVLEPGDSINVPRYEGTVEVMGAVAFRSRVLYRPGADLGYYVDRAGGYSSTADRDRVSVMRQNGERGTYHHFLFFRRSPSVTPGSTVFVPPLPPNKRVGFDWDAFVSRSAAALSAIATVLIAVHQFK